MLQRPRRVRKRILAGHGNGRNPIHLKKESPDAATSRVDAGPRPLLDIGVSGMA